MNIKKNIPEISSIKKGALLFISTIVIQYITYAQSDLKADAANYIFVQDKSASIGGTTFLKDSIRIHLLPIVNKIQWVQDHPYNWNDGAMIPAKGFQQFFRAGVVATWKNVELQIAPEWISAQNRSFEQLSEGLDQVHWRDYYRFYNFIELPQKMGDAQYRKVWWGQSALRWKVKNWQASLSTENKWWGPSERNALFLSTTAAGFAHVSFQNQQPLQTKWGGWNVEWITGTPINGGWTPPDIYKTFRANPLYVPKPNRDRLITGLNVNFTPKAIPNLVVGFEQMYMQYSSDMLRIQDYIPIKSPISRWPDDDPRKPILLTGFYFNYKMPASKASIYSEWGWNLQQTTLRNWIIQPDKGFAGTIGVKKEMTLNTSSYLELIGEMTQLQLLTRAEQYTTDVPPSWYLGSSVRQGFTTDGQLIGAGVGPGGSSQMVELNYRKGKQRLGINVERRVHNNDFYEYTFLNSLDFRRFYVDFSTTLKVDLSYKKWTMSPRLSYIRTNNYNWWLYQPQTALYFIPGRDIAQWIAQCNFIYRF